jgi:hypothetical protein
MRLTTRKLSVSLLRSNAPLGGKPSCCNNCPTANTQTLCSGSTVSWRDRNGTALSYQWKKRWNGFNNGGTISGATSSTLTITNIAASCCKLFCSGQRSCLRQLLQIFQPL